MKKTFINTIAIAAAMTLAACSSPWEDSPWTDSNPNYVENGTGENNPDNPNTPAQGKYTEQYRPQFHYTPAQNWVNDPNGLVYADGTWHLFYQYNPYGNDWGNMSWGHATSTDLMHWSEQPVAIVKGENTCGDIFSGSCVIDKDNTAGFGAGAIVAIYTGAAERQQQCIAYSTDGGKTFTNYSGNPVITNTSREHFRDPKVFWHAESKQWIMSLALGTEYGVEFYGSKDLKNWQMLSQFKMPSVLSNGGIQWECPDLIKMGEKWVLIVSVNPGGLNGGSGTMYFIGHFDGTTFIADARDYPLWLDSGADNYAGVTYHNAPDGRTVLIGWMNNWSYCGASPVSPWRSAFTLPRELSLVEKNGQMVLSHRPVPEVDKIAGEWKEISEGDYASALGGNACSHLRIDFETLTNGTVTLGNSYGEQLEITLSKSAGVMLVARNGKTGRTNFHGNFSIPAVKGKLPAEVTGLDIFIDQSSVEIFTADGQAVQTNTVYPTEAYHTVTLSGLRATMKVRPIKSVWQ